MTDPRYVLRPAAERDLADILAWSGRRYGAAQRRRYAALIATAIERLVEEPMRPGSTDRADLAPGLRSFAIALAAGRRGAGSHLLFYRWNGSGLRILRILHEAMDPARHLADPDDAP